MTPTNAIVSIATSLAESWRWIQPYDLLIALVAGVWMLCSRSDRTRRLLCRVLNFDLIILLSVPILLCVAYIFFR